MFACPSVSLSVSGWESGLAKEYLVCLPVRLSVCVGLGVWTRVRFGGSDSIAKTDEKKDEGEGGRGGES